eukprot:g13783.t1
MERMMRRRILVNRPSSAEAFKTGGKKDGAKEGGFVDIFSVEDIDDIGGGEPLYSHFESEDWALLQLRYEFFLLQESFTKDVNDPDRVAIPEVHLAYYYNKYYKKQINTKQFGFTEIPDLLKLIKEKSSGTTLQEVHCPSPLSMLLALPLPLFHVGLGT